MKEGVMFKKVAIVIAALIAGICIFAATKPDTFHFERATTINASPEKVQPFLTDFHKWQAWSPWEKLDPGMKRTYSGAESGTGAVYAWEGNSDVGAGRMEITGATPAQVDIKLDFTAPMATSNRTKFVLSPGMGGTNVTWSMDGPMPYMSKLMTVFVSMDSLLSKDFEAGLANLKAAAENAT
jgi:hypothetical protein